jgi:hypothetical protein
MYRVDMRLLFNPRYGDVTIYHLNKWSWKTYDHETLHKIQTQELINGQRNM